MTHNTPESIGGQDLVVHTTNATPDTTPLNEGSSPSQLQAVIIFKTADDYAREGNTGMVLTMLFRGIVAICEDYGYEINRSNGRSKAGRGRQHWISPLNGWRVGPCFRAHTQAEAIDKATKALRKHLAASAESEADHG